MVIDASWFVAVQSVFLCAATSSLRRISSEIAYKRKIEINKTQTFLKNLKNNHDIQRMPCYSWGWAFGITPFGFILLQATTFA